MALTTRVSNVDAHPGDHHKKYQQHRRAPDVVTAAKAKDAEEKAAKKRKKQNAIDRAGELEQKALQKAKDRHKHTGVSSTNDLDIPRARRERPIMTDVADGADKGRTKKTKKVAKIVYEDVTDDDATDDEPEVSSTAKSTAEEIGSSGSEYQQASDNEEDPDDDEEMVDAELEVDEPDTAIEEKKGKNGQGKKEKKGVMERNKIRQARDKHEKLAITPESVPEKPEESLKRKASTANTGTKAKKSKATQPSGVYENWETRGEVSRSSSTSVPTSNSSLDTANSEEVENSGILSGDDEVERASLEKEDHAKASNKFRSVAGIKIDDHPETPSLKKQPSARSGARPNFKNLDREFTAVFDVFKFYALNVQSELDPFEHLSDEKLVEIWNAHSPPSFKVANINKAGDDDKYERFNSVKRLFKRFNASQNHEFRKAGVQAVKDEFMRRRLETTEQRAAFVKAFLGSKDVVSPIRPFIWKSNDDWDGRTDTIPPTKEGIFEGCMVAKVLAEHIAVMGTVKIDGFVPVARPYGALQLAILAVLRALFCSVTGELIDSGKDCHFSKDNWGDYEIPSGKPNTKGKIVRRGTLFKPRILDLKDEEWASIITTATASVGKKKKAAIEAVAEDISANGTAEGMSEEEKNAYYAELYA